MIRTYFQDGRALYLFAALCTGCLDSLWPPAFDDDSSFYGPRDGTGTLEPRYLAFYYWKRVRVWQGRWRRLAQHLRVSYHDYAAGMSHCIAKRYHDFQDKYA